MVLLIIQASTKPKLKDTGGIIGEQTVSSGICHNSSSFTYLRCSKILHGGFCNNDDRTDPEAQSRNALNPEPPNPTVSLILSAKSNPEV